MVYLYLIKGFKFDLIKKEVNIGKLYGYIQVRKISMYNLDLYVQICCVL